MGKFSALLLLLGGAACAAQSSEDSTVAVAKAELARIQGLVEAGALPRASLEKAQDAVADAQDSGILRRTAYGSELNVDQAEEMVAAAKRRLDRRQKWYDAAAQLVAIGAAPKASLLPLSDDLEAERREVGLVEERARLIHELGEMVSAEANYVNKLAPPAEAAELAAGYSADGTFAYATYAKVEVAFRERFGRPMPVSAMGETAVHRAMGFDHRGRVDVAIESRPARGRVADRLSEAESYSLFRFSRAGEG